MNFNRRQFLRHTAHLAGLVALSNAFPAFAAEATPSYPFTLGVASGSPRHDSVVIWTRLLPEPLNALALPQVPYKVLWEVAEDENFKRIAAKGQVAALPELAHSVHVDVTGLQPDRWYWYRFMSGEAISPVARTRTAPMPDAPAAYLRVAVASCQHWEFGEYAAHRHIAAATPDLVLFLGDYIYEWGPYELLHPTKARRRDIESTNLAEYRARYAQYKTDIHLQTCHHIAPWIVTWDDHEVCNDYGNNRDERLDPNFYQRRAAAYQAFYEHMPVRLPTAVNEADRFGNMRIYERYDWGRLARFHVLDDRQYRSYQPCVEQGRGGSSVVTNAECSDRLDPTRTILGYEQEAWLAQGFASSTAKWNFLTQQTLFAQFSQAPIIKDRDGRFWTDGWDGYPIARQRLINDIIKHKPANPVILSGDVHSFFAADIKRDYYSPTSASNPVIATEFCGTSITSNSRPQEQTEQFLSYNPHIKFGRSDKRGYMLMDITPKQIRSQFMALEDVYNVDSPITPLANFVVEDGRAGVVQTEPIAAKPTA